VGLGEQVVVGRELKGFNAGTVATGHILEETSQRRKAGESDGLERVRPRPRARERTYSEAGRNTGAVGGEAGLGEGVDVVGGEVGDDLELELCGERKPARHCSVC